VRTLESSERTLSACFNDLVIKSVSYIRLLRATQRYTSKTAFQSNTRNSNWLHAFTQALHGNACHIVLASESSKFRNVLSAEEMFSCHTEHIRTLLIDSVTPGSSIFDIKLCEGTTTLRRIFFKKESLTRSGLLERLSRLSRFKSALHTNENSSLRLRLDSIEHA